MTPYKSGCWNKWTEKSKGIKFERDKDKPHCGDGELKLGAEFGVKPLGQNSSYDLNVNNEHWEVKKLDKDKSFRLGVSVSLEYRKLFINIYNCFDSLNHIKEKLASDSIKKYLNEIINSFNKSSGNSKTSIANGLLKDEVSETNLIQLDQLIEKLKKIAGRVLMK